MSKVKCPYAEKRKAQFSFISFISKFDCYCTKQGKMVSSKKFKCFSPDYVKCKFYVPPPATTTQPSAQPVILSATSEPKVCNEVIPTATSEDQASPINTEEASRQLMTPKLSGKTCHNCLLYCPSSGRCFKLMVIIKDPNDPPCLKTKST